MTASTTAAVLHDRGPRRPLRRRGPCAGSPARGGTASTAAAVLHDRGPRRLLRRREPCAGSQPRVCEDRSPVDRPAPLEFACWLRWPTVCPLRTLPPPRPREVQGRARPHSTTAWWSCLILAHR